MRLLITLCLATGLAAADQQSGPPAGSFPLPFVDEASQDESFLKFRNEFLRKVLDQDRDAVSVDISERDKAEIESSLFFMSPAWDGIARALTFGGSFTTTQGRELGRREFCAPYTFSTYPNPRPSEFMGELDPWIIIGDNVPVRAAMDEKSKVLATLSHELVAVTGFGGPPNPPVEWIEVVLGRQRGFVPADQVMSPEDYRVCFAKVGDRWLMTRMQGKQIF